MNIFPNKKIDRDPYKTVAVDRDRSDKGTEVEKKDSLMFIVLNKLILMTDQQASKTSLKSKSNTSTSLNFSKMFNKESPFPSFTAARLQEKLNKVILGTSNRPSDEELRPLSTKARKHRKNSF